MNSRILTGITLAGAFLVATLGAAGAQISPGQGAPVPVPPGAQVPGTPYGYGQGQQYDSNLNIARVAKNSERVIRALQHDDRDYGGHRVNAINDMNNAHGELVAAEQWAQAHGYATQANQQQNGGKHRGHGGGGRRSKGGSNYNIAKVQNGVERMISHLQQDNRDYGGHRAAALNWLQQANNELAAATQWESTHPG